MTMPRRFRVSLRWALLSVTAISVLLIAALIHASWQHAADRNVRAVVAQLNAQIVGSVTRQLADLLGSAAAAEEALRSMFYQNVIDTSDEVKREFLFLAQLQSQPNPSWIALGFPNGDFFGAQEVDERSIRKVEVRDNPSTGKRERRVEGCHVVPGDIEFQRREFAEADFRATDQPWYGRALGAEGAVWSEVREFPTRLRPGISTSTKLEVFQKFSGVISATIELQRLSEFIAQLKVGLTGAAYILAPDGRMLAGPPDPNAAATPEDRMPYWRTLDNGADPMLGLIRRGLQDSGAALQALTTQIASRLEAVNKRCRAHAVSPPSMEWMAVEVLDSR